MMRSLSIHNNHNAICGESSHYARTATWKAAAFLDPSVVKSSQAAHRAANRAKHSWVKRSATSCWMVSASSSSDPLIESDPWAGSRLPETTPKCNTSPFDLDPWARFQNEGCRSAQLGGDDMGSGCRACAVCAAWMALAEAQNRTIAMLSDALVTRCGSSATFEG